MNNAIKEMKEESEESIEDESNKIFERLKMKV